MKEGLNNGTFIDLDLLCVLGSDRRQLLLFGASVVAVSRALFDKRGVEWAINDAECGQQVAATTAHVHVWVHASWQDLVFAHAALGQLCVQKVAGSTHPVGCLQQHFLVEAVHHNGPRSVDVLQQRLDHRLGLEGRRYNEPVKVALVQRVSALDAGFPGCPASAVRNRVVL